MICRKGTEKSCSMKYYSLGCCGGLLVATTTIKIIQKISLTFFFYVKWRDFSITINLRFAIHRLSELFEKSRDRLFVVNVINGLS